ncbi:MAG: retropepsin-like domain-containing protein [Candidatus Riflebacteria bacterium]|nr:retropepsin-like domain-containing protein [Candidatus Riflebacteria bacterium]
MRDELPTIRAAVRGPLGRVKLTRVVVDSGSSMTIMDSGFAASIDLTADRACGDSRIRGPTGPSLGYRIIAPTIGVLGRILADHEIRVHDLTEDMEIDGVIGMDVLGRGKLILDTPEHTVEFHWK